MSMPRLGLISDTHGLLRPAALAALAGCELILHAGDIGGPEILARLAELAPTVAVRGNTDRGPWAVAVPKREWVSWQGRVFYLLHDLAELDLDPRAAGIDVVLSGHTHQPSFTEKAGVRYWNPGSAGPRRFRLPIGLAIATLEDDDLVASWSDISE